MENILNCEYCNKIFSNKSNLKKHVNTSMQCIKSRNNVNLKCESDLCNFYTNSNIFLTKHQYQCEFYTKLKEEQAYINKHAVNSAKEKIEMLEGMLKEERAKPTKSTINNVNNNINKTSNINNNKQTISNKLSIELRDEVFGKLLNPCNELFENIPQYIRDNLTTNHILGDKQSIYEFISEMVNQKMYYACLDKGGSNFIYKDPTGCIKTDIYARKLIDTISDPLIEIVDEIANSEIKRLVQILTEDQTEEITKRNSKTIRDIRTKTNTLKNIKNECKDLRKNLADKMYYPSQMVHEYKHDPDKLLESSSSYLNMLYLEDFINDNTIQSIYDSFTEDELDDIYSSTLSFIHFIIQKFLVSECRLVYMSDKTSNKFYYYSIEDENTLKKEEDFCLKIQIPLLQKTKNLKNNFIHIPEKVLNDIQDIQKFSDLLKKHLQDYQLLFIKV